GVDLDLDGLEIYDDGSESETVTGSTTVAADSYVVICVNDDVFTNGGADCDYEGSFNLANAADELYLAYDGTVFDSVLWDTAADWTVDAGASMSLDPDLLDADLNDEADAWCSSTSSYGDGDLGTPQGANDTCEVSYSYVYSDIEAIWAADCSGCHTGGGTSGNLDLDAGYSSVVDTPSDDLASMDLIEPGDTATSYIWHKVSGTHSKVGGAGSTMPLGGSLSSANLAILETWIDEGAPESNDSYTYSFYDDVMPIITANCTDYGCHSFTGGANGGYLEADAYGEMVDVASSDVPSMDRIEPGDSANSYLFQKISGTFAKVGGLGAQMPLGYTALSSDDLDLIQTWIDEGAPEN
ncbi:MAG: hypothetical protein GY884_36460, partial [Proteobacteria bacterium]|nr:hypothetical protein [Pseudomonadota bacterium]